MKLAIIMKDYDESKGGAERYLTGLLPKLRQLYESVDLIVHRVNGKIPEGVNLILVKAMRWSSVLYPLTFNWSVQRIIRKNKYDIVYGLTQIYPRAKNFGAGVYPQPSWIYRVGGGLEHSWFEIRYSTLFKRILNFLRLRILVRFYIENRIFQTGNYKKIITNSSLCKNQVLHHYKISPEDIAVIYNGVDKNKFNSNVKVLYKKDIRSSLDIPFNSKIVLFMSNNWKRKGLGELIEAFARLKDKNVYLLVVGRGNKNSYEALASRLGIGKRVIFNGPTQEPEKFYGASDIYVLPTYYDPCANVCIEAISCGLPVVTTRTNGAAELIIEGKNGFIVGESDNIHELVYCMEKALEINLQNIEETIKSLTIENNVRGIVELIKNLKMEKPNDILINNGCRKLLDKKRWDSFEKIMETEEGIQYKRNKLRSVVKINLNGENIFLKRHYKRANPSWAFREWMNIFKLKSLGVSTMEPIAVGEKRNQSFLITESLENAERLEDFIKNEKLNFTEKKELIKELASLTRRLHNNNLFHKDYYTGHIFVKKENNKFKLYLIDLQRLQRHWIFRNHWRIKDISSLNFSLPISFITQADRIRFLEYYLFPKNIKNYKRFTGKIIEKTKRIAIHTEKLLKRRNSL